MHFPRPLVRGRFMRRYKRFFAEIELADGRAATAHCANPGAMLGLLEPGAEAWLLPHSDPKRKLAWSWELVRADGHLVGINTGHPNGLAAEAIAAGRIPELAGYVSLRREVRLGADSRIDLLLESPGRPICYVEVKNVHLKRGEAAEFPDCVTARGTKHLGALAAAAAAGHRAVMLYIVQRGDCRGFRVAADLDPAYDRALKTARAQGVEALCYACRVSVEGIEIDAPLDVAPLRARRREFEEEQ
jgi:sugar fermentation stimulation protein A